MAATGTEEGGKKGGGLKKSYFDVLGICCSSEIPVIENILKEIEGIKEIRVIVATRTVIVLHDDLLVSQAQIVKALNQARFEANVRAYGDQKDHRKKWPSPYAVASGLLLLLSLLKYVNPIFRWVALAAVAAGILPIVLKSFAAVRHLRIDINILALIAVIGTIVLNDYLEAATIVFLFTIAEWLESRAAHKANAVMSSILSIAPQKAVLADTGEVVGADEVKLGTLLAVKAGEDIPIDGIVVEGKCEVDEKTLTGESFPVPKQKNSTVWAGTINLDGYVTVKTTALAEDCVVAKMAKLVEEAQNNKSKTQRFIDKCAKFYTPAVIIISTCIVVIPVALKLPNRSHWFHLALVVLVSACPCALILSTPVASFCALTKAATSGLLIKGGDYLETLGKIKIMAFDKTGTITRGEFMVTEFQVLDKDNISLDTLLYWVSSIESKSSHPMAAALVDHGRSLSIDPKPENVDDFQNFPGEGVHGRIDGKDIYIGNRKIATRANCATVPEIKDEAKDGRTVGYIFCGTIAAGVFSLSDSCRTGAKEAMDELRSLGIKTAMLTGDSSAAALQAQNELGKALQTVHAELLPQDKTRLINDFKKEGPTAMIGDGLNDAPALATADIGISMGISGSALAIETGDVILMTNDIRKVPKAIRLARRANNKVIENVILSVAPRIAILGLAFGGHPLVWAAVLADVGACVLVILNSMLLLRGTDGHKGKKAGKFSATHCSSKHKCCHVSSHSDEYSGHAHDHGCNDHSSHSSRDRHHHHHHHHEHEDCGSLKKTHDGCLQQNHASLCDSKLKNSSSCKKSKLMNPSSKRDGSTGCVKLCEHDHTHDHGCNSDGSDSSSHSHHHHHHHHHHEHEDCHSLKKTHDVCLPQNHASKCDSRSKNSSLCNKSKLVDSCSKVDGSTARVQLCEHDHTHDHGCNTECTDSSSHSHHHHHHHEHEDCGSLKKTHDGCLPQNCASKCDSGMKSSSSCKKSKLVDSSSKVDDSAGSLKPCEHGHVCNDDQPAEHDHHAYSSCADHHPKDELCPPENTQEFCSFQKCASNSCEKIKCTSSPASHNGSAVIVELDESGCCTHNTQSAQHDHDIQSPKCDFDDSHSPSLEHHINNGCCSQNNTHKVSLSHPMRDSETCNEGVHLHCKASNEDNGAINNTANIELEADHSNSKRGNTSNKPLENRETNNCKSCRRGSSQFKIGKSCAGLDKREMGGCCKSYMKECCRKHGDMRMAVRGGLNEIIIE